ncbi:globin [Mechercharimyces sp. CAU 1602]|uniref:globin domain-containing protein n=1 Tax=Mechercharimyces sp. CAU 1602 TaxID=2973933 RepID=UPI0021638D41|nr:globin [Mechercharimyces sp. CAU 1602]MCS1352774.1 globin [Mechercharimyces sp. CAU 1602]
MAETAFSLYERMGGEATIKELVEAFYPRVQAHPDLAPLFPEDIQPVMEKQTLFLTQFLGGPGLYSQKHGHPMLRARHLPFEVTPTRAEAWLQCMYEALDEIQLTGIVREELWGRLLATARHMINTPEPPS